jgi:hypothetical protein
MRLLLDRTGADLNAAAVGAVVNHAGSSVAHTPVLRERCGPHAICSATT